MNNTHTASLVVTLLAVSAFAFAKEDATPPAMPPMPDPVKEHAWLQQFVGEWETDTEIIMGPGQAPTKCKGTESDRMLGGFWLVAEGKGEFPGIDKPMNSFLTLGYDPETKKYVGTWVDSMTPMLWKYEGVVDPTGKKLTLETEGPCPTKPGTTAKFRDVMEIKSKDHRVFTSTMQNEDGTWTKMITVNYRRKS